MKKILFLFAGLFLLSIRGTAQNNINLVIFSEDGDAFYAYIDGVKQNATAETNVRFTNLSADLSLRIEFEDKTLPHLKQNMSLEAGQEHKAKIKRNAKKQLKLHYLGSAPIAETTEGTNRREYNTAEEATDNTTYNSPSNSPATSTLVYVHDYTPYSPMSSAGFAKMKESIEAQPFSDTKLSTAKVAIQYERLSVNQIKTIALLFTMDEDRLMYVKYAYDHCVDKANYYQVSSVFMSSFTADELNEFLAR